MNISRVALAAIALTAFSGVAQAQDFKVGAQVTLSKPIGDMGNSDNLDGKFGYGLGLHGVWDLKGGHAIVPRIDYTMYKRSIDSADLKVNDLKIGADYNYYISGKVSEGFYVLGGLGYSSAKWEVSMGPVSVSETKGALHLALGAGYMFTQNVGAELRYAHTKYSDVGADMGFPGQDLTGPSLSASVLFRF